MCRPAVEHRGRRVCEDPARHVFVRFGCGDKVSTVNSGETRISMTWGRSTISWVTGSLMRYDRSSVRNPIVIRQISILRMRH